MGAHQLTRMLWKVTGTGAAIAVLGFALIAAGSAGGGDSGAVTAIGAVALIAGIAVLIYAATQWAAYARSTRR